MIFIVSRWFPLHLQRMARQLRIQYDGALYHVLNRGNYRRDVFETAGAAQAFVTALEEASSRYGWRVHAYVVMRNHYHLAIETPQPNLSDGMHWLQATLATRFNRFRNERGHLFQGRYKAILLEDFSVLARVVNYIHLNPLRAGIVEHAYLQTFRWSSLARFTKGSRFPALCADDWFGALGFSDTPEGWRSYIALLSDLAVSREEQERQGWIGLSRGWAIGTAAWRQALARDHAHLRLAPTIEPVQSREFNRARWALRLRQLFLEARRTPEEASTAPKGAKWKIELAAKLRHEEAASVVWIATALYMGKPSAVRSYLCRMRKTVQNQQKAT